MVFIDLEKAYDIVPRDMNCWFLDKRSVPRGYIDIIKDMYERVGTSVRTTYKDTSEFPQRRGLHQGRH